MKRATQAAIALAAIGLIGSGVWFVASPAAACIVVGGLIWLDLLISSLRTDAGK